MSATLQVIVSVAIAAAFFVLGLFAAAYVRRPVLICTGSGGGGVGGPTDPNGMRSWSISITNRRGFLGIKFGPTAIFGFRLHGRLMKGIPVERDTARRAYVELLDRHEGDRQVSLLWWGPEDVRTGPAWLRAIDIPCGETRSVTLFVQRNSEPDRFYVFTPADQNNVNVVAPPAPDAPSFMETHGFRIRVSCQDGTLRRKLLDGTMRRDYSGGWQWEQKLRPRWRQGVM
jgi:hypothetical protein